MKTTSKLNNKGFSLIELMVVVAIIGILATVAVPSVTKFMSKARQSEARANLSALYSANKAFYVEYSGYSSGFAAIGYAPEGQLRYNTGWAAGTAAGPANYTPGYAAMASSTLEVCPFGGTGNCQTLKGTDEADPPDPTTSTSPSAPFQSFVATSIAVLRGSAVTNADVWTINHNKFLSNITDGTNAL